ncbi:hypothetical protein SO802_005004 [Lithocarpus litseifolius]|uniref:Uncharacterized protein n=1 Tax=Lithocarpus litseifolius TaxID=425828 RepID=A0AAW2DHI3_9ROSI
MLKSGILDLPTPKQPAFMERQIASNIELAQQGQVRLSICNVTISTVTDDSIQEVSYERRKWQRERTLCFQEIIPKCPRTDSNNFISADADMAYNDYYKQAIIIMERVVKLDTLEDTCIPEVFKERTWTKLLNPSGVVYSKIIREFFSNASVDGDHIYCWVRHKEFVITRESIQEFLEVRPLS